MGGSAGFTASVLQAIGFSHVDLSGDNAEPFAPAGPGTMAFSEQD